MSETGDPVDIMEVDLSSRPMGSMDSQSGNNLIALDGSLPSIHSVSLILQALLPLLLSLVLLASGRRLYRFTTTVSVALSSSLFTWALFVNLETGLSIGSWTGEVAAVTVWSVMIGGGLIGALVGYQLTWWGAHVTGRLCLGVNAGVGLAFSVLLLKSGLLIHSPGGQWSLVGAFAVMGILIVLWDHVIGPLVAIAICGSFLFLLGTDMFNTRGLDGVAAGLRLLLDHNPEHSMYITSYAPPKSTMVLMGVSWAIGFISFAFQYVCYSVPFTHLGSTEEANEEKGLDSEGKTQEPPNEIRNSQSNKEFSQSEAESAGSDHSKAVVTNVHRGSYEPSDGTKTSATLNDSNRPPAQSPQELSNLPLSSRPGPGLPGEHRSPAALALSPSIYSRYRRTQDPIHKPPSRAPIQYQLHSNMLSFNNSRRVETVDEVTEPSASVGGGDLTMRSSSLTLAGTSDTIGRSNSMSEEYINAMIHLASGDCNSNENDNREDVGTKSSNQVQQVETVKAADETQAPQGPFCQNSSVPDPGNHDVNQAKKSAQPAESKGSIASNISSPVPPMVVSIPNAATTSSLSHPHPNQTPSATQSNQTPAQEVCRNSKLQSTQPPSPQLNISHPTADQELQRTNHVDQVSDERDEGENSISTMVRSSQDLSRSQLACDTFSIAANSSSDLLNRNSRELAEVTQSEIRNARLYENSQDACPPEDTDSSRFSENMTTRDNCNLYQDADAEELNSVGNCPLSLTPSHRIRSYDRSGLSEKQEVRLKMEKVTDTHSLQSANSNSSSVLDSFLRVGHDSSVPTTPSSTGNTLKEELRQIDSEYGTSKVRLSIIVGSQAQLPRRMSTRTQASQEAQIDSLSDHSPAINTSAVPHTPILGNMLLRVSAGAEKPRRQQDIHDLGDQASNHQVSSSLLPKGEDGRNDVDDITLRSEPSRRSTICMSSIYNDHTSAEDGGRSCSESEDEGDPSHEQYFHHGKMQKIDKTLGEWNNLFSEELATEDEMEVSGRCHRKDGHLNERSPSLHSIPLPSWQNKLGSSHALAAQTSMNTERVSPIPFVGKPLEEVPWPQMRQDMRDGSANTSDLESQQKRWTTASSIFPPLGYDSCVESPSPPSHLIPDDETESYASDSALDRIRLMTSSRISNGTLTSFETSPNQQKQNLNFCSASSHVTDEQDLSDMTSRIDDTTDDEDRNYESAGDYSKSFRFDESLAASNRGYISAGDGNSQFDI